jgi:hypothetical protein
MSAKLRSVWILPAIVVASWLAVRSLAASPGQGLDDPPAPLASAQTAHAHIDVRDPGLERLIKRFAAVARARTW